MLFVDNAMTKHHLFPFLNATCGKQNEAKFFLPTKIVFVSIHTFASSL